MGAVLAVLTSLLAAALPWQPTELVLERSKRQLRVIQNGRQIARYSVAVGRGSNPTPLGTHRVHRLEKDPIWSSPWRKRQVAACLLYTSPSPRDISGSRMPSSA